MLAISISTPAARSNGGLFAQIRRALGWPARVLETRRTLASLAELSEREWQDFGAARRDFAEEDVVEFEEDPAERIARERAIRAWYGAARNAKAA